MLRVLSKPPGGDFSVDLFQQICKPLSEDIDCIFAWRGYYTTGISIHQGRNAFPPEIISKSYIFLEKIIKKPVCILWITDDLNIIKHELEQFFDNNKQTHFILVTGLKSFEILAPNCIIVEGPSCITHHMPGYQAVNPVLEKNLDSDTTFISLNRFTKIHRYLSLCLLLGYGLEKYGYITYLSLEDKDMLHPIHLDKIRDSIINQSNLNPDEFIELFLSGEKRLETYELKNTDDPKTIYLREANDNPGNFNDRLSNYYKNSFIEFINETTCENGLLITEKTLNSIYGCNFPIWISNTLTPNIVKSLGIDIFDDIINHDYQYEDNLYLRVQKAIKFNKKLLSDPDKVKKLWIKNKPRFEKNIEFARQGLYDTYAKRTSEQIHNILKQLNIHYENGATN